MLRTEDLMQMKIKPLLAENALIAVWCTNSESHIQAVHNNLFPAWGVTYIATWYWLKVDRSGTPVSAQHLLLLYNLIFLIHIIAEVC